MELKWLDDYIALIDTGSFSAAAQRRHVSQPAFSRRIQMLEAWLGVTLIDRSRKPLRLTQVAAEHQAAFRSLVSRVYEFRALLNSAALDSAVITIAAQHTLAAAYLPAVLARLQSLDPAQRYRIRSENRTDSVAMLMRGEAEILVTYETPQSPCGIPPAMARREVLGRDELMLVANPALHSTLARAGAGDTVPMLCFPPESFFGQAVRADAMADLMRRHPVAVRCVSEFAMGLRELTLIGQGAAWLPRALIRDDLRQRRLLPLPTLGNAVAMDIVAYMTTPEGHDGAVLAAQLQALRSVGAPPPRATKNSR